MSVLSATFTLIDKMSDKFDKMANSGQHALEQWERAGEIGDEAFENTARAATQTAQAMNSASQSTDHWTEKIGNYDKGAMEAVYSTEELVEMGYKATNALDQEADAANEAAESSEKYSDSAENAASSTELLEDVLVATGISKLLKGIADATMECVDNFQEYQTSVAKVNTLADTSVKSIDDISSEVMALSNDVGQASSDIAEATYQAISAGIDTANSVDFVRQANELAVGGFTSATTAVDVLTTALNAYGLETSNASQIADYLITTQNLGKTTVDELANSVGKVIPIAAAYNVEMDNLSTAYAVLTANGIATAEAGTYLKAMLNELGDSGSAVTAVLINETGMSFAQLTKQGYSLGDVMAILGDSVNNNAGAFNELWSSSEAGVGALSLLNSGAERYNDVLNEMQNSTGATADAFDKMTETSAFAEQKMKNAANNLKIAIGEVLAPSINGVNEALYGFLNNTTAFVKENPAVVKGVAALTVGLTTYTGAIVAYTVAKKAATVAKKAWLAIQSANPYYLIAAGVGAATAALVTYVATMSTAENETDKLTSTSQKQAKQLQELEERYKSTCNAYGENSYEAWQLKQEVDALSVAYENNKQTAEEYEKEVNNLIDTLRASREEYEETSNKLDNEYESSTALIAKLQELGSESELAARNQALIIPIIDELNSRYEGLGLTFDALTGKFNMTPEEMQEIAWAEIDIQKREEDWKRYVEVIGKIPEAEEALAKAEEKLVNDTDVWKEKKQAFEDYEWSIYHILDVIGQGGSAKLTQLANNMDQSEKTMNAQQETVNTLRSEYEGLIQTQTEIEEQYGYMTDATEESKNAFISYGDAVNIAMSSVQTEVTELCAAYDEAYESARKSIDGQIGLFDAMKLEYEISVDGMTKAWESQINYLMSYSENLHKAMEYGFDKSLVAKLSDGSEESAAYLDTIITKVETIGAGSEQAAIFVEKFNTKFLEVEKAKDTFASAAADVQTDFTNTMEDIEKTVAEGIDNLNMSDDAAEAAKMTMSAYINEIVEGGNSAAQEAQKAAEKVKTALEKGVAPTDGKWSSWQDAANAGYSHIRTESEFARSNSDDRLRYGTYDAYLDSMYFKYNGGYASGTNFATPGWHLVGEEGPEIVEFAGGETVYPADETSRMLASMRPTPLNTNVPESLTGQKTEDVATKDRRIVVAIEGGGEINVKGDVSKETVVELLVSNLKPVLLNMIQEEVFEEGDGSYEY